MDDAIIDSASHTDPGVLASRKQTFSDRAVSKRNDDHHHHHHHHRRRRRRHQPPLSNANSQCVEFCVPKMGYTACANESGGDLSPHLSPRFLSYARTALGRSRSRWCWATDGYGTMDRLTLTLRSSLIWVVILYLEPIANGVFDAVLQWVEELTPSALTRKAESLSSAGASVRSLPTKSLCRSNQPPFINGGHCTGDAMALDKDIGTKTIELEWRPVHTIGMEKPGDPDDKINVLADEALRSVRGLVSDAQGNLFANKLARRDYQTGEIWKNKPTFRLALYKAVFDEIVWHCKHYTGCGVMNFYESGAALAQNKMEETDEAQYQVLLKTTKDADGGPFPGYTSKKSWDEAFYHNVISGADFAAHPYYSTIAIHYCKGGFEYDANAALMGTDFQLIPGPHAADEAAEGVLSGANVAAHPYYVTTVIHYCKGGLESDENSAFMGTDCQSILGLYAAGEAAGRVLLRSSCRTHGMKYVSGGEVIPTCSRERTSQRIFSTLPSSSTIARVV